MGPILEQHPVRVLQPGQASRVQPARAAPHHELVGAGHDGGGVELEAAEPAHDVGEAGGVGAGTGAGEELRDVARRRAWRMVR